MRIINYRCDYCDRDIKGEVMALDVGRMGEKDLFESSYTYKHYCPECLEQVLKIRKKKPTTQKKDLDMDRILSLRDAGWTLEKIGDEFGVSAQTIANRLKEVGV